MFQKKIKLFWAALGMLLSFSMLAAQATEMVKVFSYNKSQQEIEVSVPFQPKRIAVTDFAILDIVDSLGYGDRIVALTKNNYVDYLDKYFKNDKIINIGALTEIDLERLAASKPDIIFIGTRLSKYYDQLVKIAPVVFLALDYSHPLLQDVKRNATAVEKIFNKDSSKVDSLLGSFEERIAILKTKSNHASALVGMVTGGHFNSLSKDSRGAAFINYDAGFNVISAGSTATHGNETSFEYILQVDPDYIFVLDRDSAIQRQGMKLAKDIMNNELVNKTKAYKNDQIIYLHPGVWYLAIGGLQATNTVISDIEKAFK